MFIQIAVLIYVSIGIDKICDTDMEVLVLTKYIGYVVYHKSSWILFCAYQSWFGILNNYLIPFGLLHYYLIINKVDAEACIACGWASINNPSKHYIRLEIQ